MVRRGAAVLAGVGLLAVGVIAAACGSDSPPKPRPIPPPPPSGKLFTYDARAPLALRRGGAAQEGPVRVERLSYRSYDGSRVPALLAVPRPGPSRGCLIYQPGVGQPKEAAAPIWPAAATLGLSVFTIDPRFTGARASAKVSLADARRNTDDIVTLVRRTVIDLRRGIDLLERRPECDRKIGFLGSSLGGTLGALVAGSDRRVRASVLTSIGPTWRSALINSDLILPGVRDDPKRLAAALERLAPYDPATWIRRIAPRPVMLVNGLRDPYVSPVDALNLAAAAHQPKTVLEHPGGHDPFAGPQGTNVAQRVARFLQDELLNPVYS